MKYQIPNNAPSVDQIGQALDIYEQHRAAPIPSEVEKQYPTLRVQMELSLPLPERDFLFIVAAIFQQDIETAAVICIALTHCLVTAELQEQLRQASWASLNQAERQFRLGEWQEGIALLARAIKFDPENQIASERFFQELIAALGCGLGQAYRFLCPSR